MYGSYYSDNEDSNLGFYGEYPILEQSGDGYVVELPAGKLRTHAPQAMDTLGVGSGGMEISYQIPHAEPETAAEDTGYIIRYGSVQVVLRKPEDSPYSQEVLFLERKSGDTYVSDRMHEMRRRLPPPRDLLGKRATGASREEMAITWMLRQIFAHSVEEKLGFTQLTRGEQRALLDIGARLDELAVPQPE